MIRPDESPGNGSAVPGQRNGASAKGRLTDGPSHELGNAQAEIMTADQARVCVERINDGSERIDTHLGQVRALVLELYESLGWKVLGYKSWRACVTTELKFSQSRLYQIVDAAKVERNLFPTLEKRLPLSQRVVDQVKDLPAEQQREVWKEAVKTAPNGRVTAAHIKKVKDAVTPKEPDNEVGDEVDFPFDEVSPEKVLTLSSRLDDLTAKFSEKYHDRTGQTYEITLDDWKFTVEWAPGKTSARNLYPNAR
jgi:hypothetical protein